MTYNIEPELPGKTIVTISLVIQSSIMPVIWTGKMYLKGRDDQCENILLFPEGKHKVFTLSYDDGKCADRRLIEIMNRYGVRGTFHLNAGLIGSQDRIPKDEIKDYMKGMRYQHIPIPIQPLNAHPKKRSLFKSWKIVKN